MNSGNLVGAIAVLIGTIFSVYSSAAATEQPGAHLEPRAPLDCVPIPDNTYRGDINASGQAVCAAFTVPGTGVVNALSLQLAISHTFVGDLVFKVQNPSRTKTVTLMSRPGFAELQDDGASSGAGDSSNLNSSYPVTFSDSYTTSAESMGAIPSTLGNADVVCRDQGSPCNYHPNPGAAVSGNLSMFDGDPVGAGWRICVGDRAETDVGSICEVISNNGTPGVSVNYSFPSAANFNPIAVNGNTSTSIAIAAPPANTAPIQLSTCVITGPDASDFAIAGPNTPTTIPAGTTQTISLQFSPTVVTPATRRAVLECQTPNATSPNWPTFRVSINATVTQPPVSYAHSIVSLGFVKFGGRLGHEGNMVDNGNPLQGSNSTIHLALKGQATSVKLVVLSIDGSTLRTASMAQLPNGTGPIADFESSLVVPSEIFRVIVEATDANGDISILSAPTVFRPATISVSFSQPLFISDSIGAFSIDAIVNGGGNPMTLRARAWDPTTNCTFAVSPEEFTVGVGASQSLSVSSTEQAGCAGSGIRTVWLMVGPTTGAELPVIAEALVESDVDVLIFSNGLE